jgi:NAD(P)-dependent dehydrogenase (short-subunit alcohol dehydrogenase family)
MAGEGARLFCVDMHEQGVEEAAAAASAGGAEAEARVCNVADPEQVDATIGACVKRFGRLDALCNVAGVLHFAHTHEVELEDWQRVLSVNLTGTFLMCRAALPHLLDARGHIVNTASTAALAGLPYGAAYAASKGGVVALTRTLAVEYGRRGLRANAVCPGSIKTPITKTPMPSDLDATLIPRLMALDGPRGPEAVAGVIALLASHDGEHINGEVIRVDGGTLA